jgi:hypothetical protein
MSWLSDLEYDAMQPLLSSSHDAIEYWTKRAILHEKMPMPRDVLWDLKVPQNILRKQRADGSWAYPSPHVPGSLDYNQIETYRQLGFLVEMFGFDRGHPQIEQAAEYILSNQTDEGDIRGIYARQYSPNYTAALLELLVKAGYDNDARVTKAFSWLDSVRQDDGGWALAFRTQGRNLDAIYDRDKLLALDPTKPFSHLVTGVVLRAYAAHPIHKTSDSAKQATALLVSRLFEKDVYPDRDRTDDWIRFSFPFWQTDILSALTIVGIIDPHLADNPKVLQAKQWFIDHQQPDGLFAGHLLKDRYHDLRLWYSYAICRAFDTFACS